MSSSEDFEVEQTDRQNSFFSGLFVGTLLSAKHQNVRQQIAKNSQQNYKSRSLNEKVDSIQRNRNKSVAKKDKTQDSNPNSNKGSEIGTGSKGKEQKPQKESRHKIRKSFQDLRLIKPLLKSISEADYISPTPIQCLAIPAILSGKDIVASSVTGSGKTAAFLFPIMQRYYNASAVGYVRAMIVTPTRELAIQIYEHFQMFNKYIRIDATLAIGASSLSSQEQSIRNNPELVIATPGRIIDLLMNSRSIGLENLEVLILDEADKLLELGFQKQIEEMMKYINPEVQTILFSATMDNDIKKLAALTTRKPVRISADPDNRTAQKLHQQMIKLKNDDDVYREAVLISVLQNIYSQKVIVFFKTKKQCHRIAIIMNLLGSRVCELHGNLSQTQRINAFVDFKDGKYDYMMATDLAARGLDVKEVKTVINFELPTQLTRYIHRIGRTARAGSTGTSLTLCSDSECRELKKMTRKTGDKLYRLSLEEAKVKDQVSTINELERDIGRIAEEEREERAMRRAEMELDKLTNVNDHQEEIYSRPKKIWFISEKEKKEIQKKAKAEAGVPEILAPPKEKKIQKFHQKKRHGR